MGLEYIHSNKVIHRDIKPENLVLDDKGYLRITDFGVAKLYQKENSSETSGTPGYMAPEVMCAQNHNYLVDYFAIGVITFEFMFGVRPYLGKSRKEIKDLILSKQVQVKRVDIPEDWSVEAADFINKVSIYLRFKTLQRKPANRLGCGGIKELREHPWFNNYPWDDLNHKRIISPFIPKQGDNYDKKYCEAVENINNSTYERYQSYYHSENFGSIFKNYTFLNNQEYYTETPNTSTKKNASNHRPNQLSATNLLSKTKIKVSDRGGLTLMKANSSRDSVGDSSHMKIRIKNNSMTSLPYNLPSSKAMSSVTNISNNNHGKITSINIHATPYKSNQNLNQLPFIESKLFKNVSKAKVVNSASSSNKLTNSSSTHSVIKNTNKFSTINPSASTFVYSGKNIQHRKTSSNFMNQ